MIIKKLTIVYGNVKSFDLLMRDFYHTDQGEEATIPSFATQIEGLLSQIRDRFPDQLPQEEQRLLKDHLFHCSRKSIRDSVKCCFADASLDYMHFPGGMQEGRGRGEGWSSQGSNQSQGDSSHSIPNQGGLVDQTAQVSTTSDRCLGGAGQEPSISCEGHTSLLQWGQARWFWEANPRHMERGL